MENLNSCEFLEGLSCYQPFEHITCHLTTFRRPNWPIVSLLFMNGNGWREAAFIVYLPPLFTFWIFGNFLATFWHSSEQLSSILRAQSGQAYSLVKKLLLIQPSSASAESVLTLLTNAFGSQQESTLQDYLEASVMLRYNNAKRV